jgi:DNA-binding LytR/AlgR family response regulator
MRLNYLIIDDEPIVHTLIKKFSDDLGSLEFLGGFFNTSDVLKKLDTQQIDIIFLDIQMPTMTGFDFLRTLKNPPHVIIISAHRDYALESYEFAITDYLLKPFNFARFSVALEKVRQDIGKNKLRDHESQDLNHNTQTHIFIKDDKKQHKISINDIIYIKANGNFTSIYHAQGHILSPMKISDFEKTLNTEKFSRIHRSYMIAHQAVTIIKANEIHLGETIIPIGRVYKNHIIKKFKI